MFTSISEIAWSIVCWSVIDFEKLGIASTKNFFRCESIPIDFDLLSFQNVPKIMQIKETSVVSTLLNRL